MFQTNCEPNETLPELHIIEKEDNKSVKLETDAELHELNMNIELKIVEDEDIKVNKTVDTKPDDQENPESTENQVQTEVTDENKTLDEESNPNHNSIKAADSEDNILNSVEFPKIDIVKYRRNSSVNEDDIRLRRGNLEDFHALTNKRSKSLTNDLDTSYMAYDINLNEHRNSDNVDANDNEEPQKVVCKLYEESSRKQSIDTISSTEKEFLEIDKATRELEREISKLNSALHEEDIPSVEERLSVSEIKRRFDKNDTSSPNPIPKPRRSHYGGSNSPVQ